MSRLSSSTLKVGDSSPPLVLPTRDGELVDLAGLLDLGAVLLFFVPGTWSPNTRRQLEAVERAHDQFRAIGVLPVVVATQDQGRLTKALMHSSPSFLILSDETRDAARDYGVYRAVSWDGFGVTCPSVFLIDREAKVRFIYAGERDADVPDVETILSLVTWLLGPPAPEEIASEDETVAAQATVVVPVVETEAIASEEEEAASGPDEEAAIVPAEAPAENAPTDPEENAAEAAPLEVTSPEVVADGEYPPPSEVGESSETVARVGGFGERNEPAPNQQAPSTNGSASSPVSPESSVGSAPPDVRST